MLFWQQFKAQLTGLLIWLGSAVALVLVIAQSAPSFVQNELLSGYLQAMPASIQAMMGLQPDLDPLDAFVAAQVTKSLLLVVALYAVLLALQAITREVDRRTIDFLLAMPIRRSDLLLARTAVMLVNTGLLTLGMALSTRFSLQAQGLQGYFRAYDLIFLNCWLLAVALGAIALLASLWIDDYALGVKLMLGLVSVAYFVEFVLRAVNLSRAARLLSPFSYLDSTHILKHGSLPLGDALVLAAVALLAIGLSLPAFERKQIAA